MRNGYDQFFQNARRAAKGATVPHSPKAKPKVNAGPRFELSSEQLEEQLKKRAGIKRRKRRSFPWVLTAISLVGFLLAGWGIQNSEKAESFVKGIEIDWMGSAMAEEKKPEAKGEKAGEGHAAPAEKAAAKPAEAVAEEVNHLSKLNDRKKELDAREEELSRQEVEIAKQKEDLERRLKELEDMRSKISEMLADRVKADDTKVETLVQMYSNMKATQAAKVFETMDENLAVEIIGRMKKKNAADIMNLLKPEKAQLFSEKYAGYKRK